MITGGEFLGTIKYAAPEYLLGEEYSNNIDCYSLGLILYELFTGKSFIDNELYWSRLIIIKINKRVYFSGININPKIKKLSLKEIKFLKAVTDGCLTQIIYTPTGGRHHDDDSVISRFSSSQLQEAFESHVWEKSFSYPISHSHPSFQYWPDVDDELEKQVRHFIKNRLALLPSAAHNILLDAANRYDGLIYTGPFINKLENDFQWMIEEGLVSYTSDPEEGDEYFITALAWQLIFRGVICNYNSLEKNIY
jgi:serine/threonine protein kinase